MAELMDPLAAAFRHDGTNGEAVILIHGFTGAPSHFLLMADELHAEGYTVNVPRLAGHGTSMEDMATTGASDWIESARRAIADVSDHDRIHLAGLSMGGLLSVLLANESEAASVTTINSPVVVRDKTLYAAPVARFVKKKVLWPDTGEAGIAPELVKYWLPYPGFYTKNAVDLLAIGRRAVVAARQVNVPSLVIQSKTDESVSPRSAEILCRLLGDNCRLKWLVNSMHLALLDDERDRITAALLDRINRPT